MRCLGDKCLKLEFHFRDLNRKPPEPEDVDLVSDIIEEMLYNEFLGETEGIDIEVDFFETNS